MDLNGNNLFRNLSIGAIASIPYAGGVLAYILDKVMPEEISIRYMSFIDALEKDIISINKNIDYSRFETPEFYSMFVKVINEIVSNHIEEKITIFKNILINTVDSSWKCNKNEYFFSITRHISTDALEFLFIVYSGISQICLKEETVLVNELMAQFPTQKNYLLDFVTELVRYKLITGTGLTELGREYCDYIFSPLSPYFVGSPK